jgi:hypothetical protein
MMGLLSKLRARFRLLAVRFVRASRTTALIRAGLARPPRRALPPDFWERPRPADPEGRALAALLEERAEADR